VLFDPMWESCHSDLCQASGRHLRMFHSWIKEYEHLEGLQQEAAIWVEPCRKSASYGCEIDKTCLRCLSHDPSRIPKAEHKRHLLHRSGDFGRRIGDALVYGLTGPVRDLSNLCRRSDL
jgi:hypothetical protein